MRARWLIAVLAVTGLAAADGRELLVLADRLARDVSALRGLPVVRPVRRGVLDRAQILARIQELVAEQYTPEDIRREGEVLKRLGLVPPELDYPATVFGVLREQVAGFYDPHAQRLFIASWLGPSMQEPTLAHEIEHALQDQHFHIGDLLRRQRGASDRQAAVSALCEGDAVAVMVDYLLRSTGRDFTAMPNLAEQIRATAAGRGQPELQNAPRAIREMLLFPYVDGTEFVRALKLRSGATWSQIDAAFRAPPDSTEQILHPERFLTRDPPVAVTVPDSAALAASHRVVHRDVLGELTLRVYLQENVPERQAREAAAGWGGDQLALYERLAPSGSAPGVDDLAAVTRLAWDSETDATEFVEAAALALERRFPRCRRIELPGGVGRALNVSAASGLVRQGNVVAWAEGVPAESLAAVLAEALR